MSTIIFDRLAGRHGVPCDTEQEVEDEQTGDSADELESPHHEVHMYKNLKNSNQLLNAMIFDHKLDYLVIRIKKNQEFSFAVKNFGEPSYDETNTIWCEDKYILSFIDNEEIPPVLSSMIASWWTSTANKGTPQLSAHEPGENAERPSARPSPYRNIFYNGCVLAEIRNYRQPITNAEYYMTYFVLLKPSRLTFHHHVATVMDLTRRQFKWTTAARCKLESRLISAQLPKLCLDLNPNMSSLAKKLIQRKNIFGSNGFLRMQRRKLKRSILLASSQPRQLKLLGYIGANRYSKSIPARIPTNTINDHELFNTYQYKDIREIAQDLTHCQNNSEELIKQEEHTLEHLDSHKCARLIIFWRPFDDSFYGTLLNDKHVQCKGPPDFYLGRRQAKDKYVEQFIEQYTEHENKVMRIIQRIGNEPPKEKLTFAAIALKMKSQSQSQPQHQGGNATPTVISALQKKSHLQKILRTGNVVSRSINSTDDKSELAYLMEQKPGTSLENLKGAPLRHSVSQMQGNVIRVSNLNASTTANAGRFIRPTSTITLNASRIATSTSASNDHTYQMERYLPDQSTKSNISVTYLSPSNVSYMSGSKVYTVRPSTSREAPRQLTPNQQQFSQPK